LRVLPGGALEFCCRIGIAAPGAHAEQSLSTVRKESTVVRKHGGAIVLALVLAVGFTLPGDAQQGQSATNQNSQTEARERNLRTYTELLRSDLRSQKVAVITQIMEFTEDEDAAFWPVYREYEFELTKLNDERLRLIESYAEAYTKLTDATANELIVKALDLEARRTTLKQKYYSKLRTVISPLTAARALQVEHQIELLVDLQIAASLPVAR
jgi:hypothetical protein